MHTEQVARTDLAQNNGKHCARDDSGPVEKTGEMQI
jgi:hypothetical protein